MKHAETKVTIITLRIMWDEILLTPFLRTLQGNTLKTMKNPSNEGGIFNIKSRSTFRVKKIVKGERKNHLPSIPPLKGGKIYTVYRISPYDEVEERLTPGIPRHSPGFPPVVPCYLRDASQRIVNQFDINNYYVLCDTHEHKFKL